MTVSPLVLPNGQLQLTEAQKDCLYKVEELVKEIKKGNVHAVGIVVCMKKGYAHVLGGMGTGFAAAEVNLGLDSLKRVILDSVDHG